MFCTSSYSPAACAATSSNNFEQLFGFPTFLAPLLVLTYRLPIDLSRFSSWPWPWIFKVKYGIFYISAKNGPIATKPKANISIKIWASNVSIGFDLGHDLDLEFSRSNMEFAISQPKMVRLPWNKKQTYRFNSRPPNVTISWPWPWLWPWIFKVKHGICYISAKSGPIAKKLKANISIEL